MSLPTQARKGARVPAATDYQVNIAMEQETIDDLNSGKFHLFGFKAVQTAAAAVPVVWFKTGDFALSTSLNWQVQYSVYTSETQDLSPHTKITASNTYEADLGSIATVTSVSGSAVITEGGIDPHGMEFRNTVSTAFTCGLSLPAPNGPAAPLCAFNLYGNQEVTITPIEQIVLVFATDPLDTGSVIEQGFGETLLIDLTQAPSRDVSYDINKGWSWGGKPWAHLVPQDGFVPALTGGGNS